MRFFIFYFVCQLLALSISAQTDTLIEFVSQVNLHDTTGVGGLINIKKNIYKLSDTQFNTELWVIHEYSNKRQIKDVREGDLICVFAKVVLDSNEIDSELRKFRNKIGKDYSYYVSDEVYKLKRVEK